MVVFRCFPGVDGTETEYGDGDGLVLVADRPAGRSYRCELAAWRSVAVAGAGQKSLLAGFESVLAGAVAAPSACCAPLATAARRMRVHTARRSRLSVSTATKLGIVPGLGCAYAGKLVQAAGWFVSVAAFEALFFVLAFPKGGLTTFGLFVVGLIQAVALLIWGGSIRAARQHVRAANRG